MGNIISISNRQDVLPRNAPARNEFEGDSQKTFSLKGLPSNLQKIGTTFLVKPIASVIQYSLLPCMRHAHHNGNTFNHISEITAAGANIMQTQLTNVISIKGQEEDKIKFMQSAIGCIIAETLAKVSAIISAEDPSDNNLKFWRSVAVSLDGVSTAAAVIATAEQVDPDRGEGAGWASLGVAMLALTLRRVTDGFLDPKAGGKLDTFPVNNKEFIEKEVKVARLSEQGYQKQTCDLFQDACTRYQQALQLMNDLGQKQNGVLALSNQGDASIKAKDFESAATAYADALNYRMMMTHNQSNATKKGGEANIAYLDEDYDVAIRACSEAVDLHSASYEFQNAASANGHLGVMYAANKQLAEAIVYYEKASAYDSVLNRETLGTANNYSNLANACKKQSDARAAEGKFPESERFFEKAIAAYEKSVLINDGLEATKSKASNLGNLGKAYQSRGFLSGAINKYTDALEIYRKLDAKPQMELAKRLIASTIAQQRVSMRDVSATA